MVCLPFLDHLLMYGDTLLANTSSYSKTRTPPLTCRFGALSTYNLV